MATGVGGVRSSARSRARRVCAGDRRPSPASVRDTSGAVLPGVTVEASSPALIEKTRTVVTDGAGQYRIEQLRGGVYTVTFTLSGFQTLKRDGIELSGSFAATVNADLKVGVARRDHHRHRRDAGRRRPERDQAARRRSGAARGDSDRPHAAGRGVSDSRREPEQRGCRRHQHHQHHRRVVVGARRQSRRHASADRRRDDREHGRHRLFGQHAAEHGQHAGSRGRLLGRHGGEHQRRTADQHDPEDRQQPLLGHAVRHRRHLVAPEQQHRPDAGRPRAGDAQQREVASATSIPGSAARSSRTCCGSTRRRGSPNQENYVGGLFQNKNAGDITKWTYVPDTAQPGGERGQREERQPPADVAGEPEAEAELLLRPALALPVRGHLADHLAGGGQRDSLPDQRSAIGRLHGHADQPRADRGAVRRPPRGIRLHADLDHRSAAAADSGHRTGRPDSRTALSRRRPLDGDAALSADARREHPDRPRRWRT